MLNLHTKSAVTKQQFEKTGQNEPNCPVPQTQPQARHGFQLIKRPPTLDKTMMVATARQRVTRPLRRKNPRSGRGRYATRGRSQRHWTGGGNR